MSWWDHGRCLGVGLSLGPMDAGGIRGGIAREDAHERTVEHEYLPCFGALVRDKTPTTASSLVCVYIWGWPGYRSAPTGLQTCSLSCIRVQNAKLKNCSYESWGENEPVRASPVVPFFLNAPPGAPYIVMPRGQGDKGARGQDMSVVL